MTATASFPAEAASVPAARRFVRRTLGDLGLDSAADTASLLVSEVATNAVLHAKSAFTVDVQRVGDVVRVSVRDGSPTIPRQRSYGVDSATGRGIRLVASVATAWGVEAGDGGKTVWFEVPASDEGEVPVESWESSLDVDALLAGFDDAADDEASEPRAVA